MKIGRRARWGLGLGAGGVGLSTLALVGLWAATERRFQRTWDEIPYPDITQRTDPETLARGEYLVWNVVGCPKCHLPHEAAVAYEPGERPPLEGGWKLESDGFAVIYVPNITPDAQTGVGRYTAPEIGRAVRTGVLPDGRFGMTMAGALGDMTDRDLEAVVSYVMSRSPVRVAYPPDEAHLMYKVVLAWFIDPVKWPGAAIPGPAPARGDTLERGAYLVNGPSNCAGCHSPMDMMTFTPDGPPLSGAHPQTDFENPQMELVAPNLTPDPATGRTGQWTEDQFVARIRAGRTYDTSTMPWETFAGMDEADLRAIYRYLHSLDPVVNDTGPTYRKVGSYPG